MCDSSVAAPRRREAAAQPLPGSNAPRGCRRSVFVLRPADGPTRPRRSGGNAAAWAFFNVALAPGRRASCQASSWAARNAQLSKGPGPASLVAFRARRGAGAEQRAAPCRIRASSAARARHRAAPRPRQGGSGGGGGSARRPAIARWATRRRRGPHTGSAVGSCQVAKAAGPVDTRAHGKTLSHWRTFW
jgi:hypothetical protein